MYAPYIFGLLRFSPHVFPLAAWSSVFHFLGITIAVFIFLKMPINITSKPKRSKIQFLFIFPIIICLTNLFLTEWLHIVTLGGDKLITRIFIAVDLLYALLFVVVMIEAFSAKNFQLAIFLLLAYTLFMLGAINKLSSLFFASWMTIWYFLNRPKLRPKEQCVDHPNRPISGEDEHQIELKNWFWTISGAILMILVSALPSQSDTYREMLRQGHGLIALLLTSLKLIFISPRIEIFIFLLIVIFFLLRYRRDQKTIFIYYILLMVAINYQVVSSTLSQVNIMRQWTPTKQVADWIMSETPKTALFLTPMVLNPHVRAPELIPSIIHRNVLIDYTIWNTFNYYRDILPASIKPMKVVYNVDLIEKSKSKIDVPALLRELDDKYYNGLDENRINIIKREYPKLKYIIFYYEKHNEADTLKDRYRALDLVFQNTNYVIFKIKKVDLH
jgi:hypothetical protein